MLQIIQVHINNFTKIDLKPYVVSLKPETGRLVIGLAANGMSGLIKENMKCSFGFSVREVYRGRVRKCIPRNGRLILTCRLDKNAGTLVSKMR